MAEENGRPSGGVPDWLDSGFFERALRAGLDDPGLRVRRSEVRPATVSGENYVGLVFGATVTTEADEVKGEVEEERQHRLIIKCLPSNKARQAISNRGGFFRKEVEMYQVVLKEFSRLASGGAAVGALPWPKHYASFFDGEGDFIMLEDLRVDGYVMGDRMSGLDGEHLEIALRAVAKFHAFSYALKLKEPEVFRTKVYARFQDTLFAIPEGMMTRMIRESFRDTASFSRTWGEGKYVGVADWLDSSVDTIRTDIIGLLSGDDPGSVLNHGDLWVNNILFRYSSAGEGSSTDRVGKPVDVKFLDFQISRLCSPAGDLSYLFATSTTAAVRKEHWEHLLKNTYLETFWDTMEALGAKQLAEAGVYTWPWLQSEMLRYRPFLLVTFLTLAQVILAEVSDVPDMDSMTDDQLEGKVERSPLSGLGKNIAYKDRLREILDEFLDGDFFQSRVSTTNGVTTTGDHPVMTTAS